MEDHVHEALSEEEHAYLHAHGLPHSHGHVHENQKAVVNRLARAVGHLEKVKRMVEVGMTALRCSSSWRQSGRLWTIPPRSF